MSHNPGAEPVECPDCGRSISRKSWDGIGCPFCVAEGDSDE